MGEIKRSNITTRRGKKDRQNEVNDIQPSYPLTNSPYGNSYEAHLQSNK